MGNITKEGIRKLEQDFLNEFKIGLTGIIKASNILVRLLEVDPESRTRLIVDYKIPSGTITTMERIGNKQLLPELAFGDKRLQALPISEQERILNSKIDVLVLKSNGETDVLQVDIKTAPPEIKNQVLNGDHIRPLNEQRAYLVGKSNQAQTQNQGEVNVVPWRTYGKKKIIILEANTVLTSSDLLTMMRAIEE
jgi:hypothetical protein